MIASVAPHSLTKRRGSSSNSDDDNRRDNDRGGGDNMPARHLRSISSEKVPRMALDARSKFHSWSYAPRLLLNPRVTPDERIAPAVGTIAVHVRLYWFPPYSPPIDVVLPRIASFTFFYEVISCATNEVLSNNVIALYHTRRLLGRDFTRMERRRDALILQYCIEKRKLKIVDSDRKWRNSLLFWPDDIEITLAPRWLL
jgi:hypothetical protein